ncbi:hypothetical protein VXE41_20775, partial [Acinetobacter variabilis]
DMIFLPRTTGDNEKKPHYYHSFSAVYLISLAVSHLVFHGFLKIAEGEQSRELRQQIQNQPNTPANQRTVNTNKLQIFADI